MLGHSSEDFRKILKILLHIGNYLNGKTSYGKCKGFHLSSLRKLRDARSSTRSNVRGNNDNLCKKVKGKERKKERREKLKGIAWRGFLIVLTNGNVTILT